MDSFHIYCSLTLNWQNLLRSKSSWDCKIYLERFISFPDGLVQKLYDMNKIRTISHFHIKGVLQIMKPNFSHFKRFAFRISYFVSLTFNESHSGLLQKSLTFNQCVLGLVSWRSKQLRTATSKVYKWSWVSYSFWCSSSCIVLFSTIKLFYI